MLKGSDEENTSTPSTHWEWRRVMIRPAPERPPRHGQAKPVLPALAARNPRDPLTVTLRYRGGAEAWWEISARGRKFRVPGYLALHDVMQRIHQGNIGHPRD